MRWKRRVNKTWRLFHVDLFSKNTIEEGIVNIKLMNLLISRNRDRENQSDSGLLNNWIEGFRIINTLLLVQQRKKMYVAAVPLKKGGWEAMRKVGLIYFRVLWL